MARTSQITFGQIAQIADQMKAAGTRPTARAVRERIGSGSMGTIHKLLQQWNGKANADADEENEGAELPAHIQNALMDFIGTEIATACEPINEELQAAKAATDELAEENERLEKTIDELEKDSYKAEMNRAEALANYRSSANDLAAEREETAKLRAQVTDLLRENDLKSRQLEMMATKHVALAKAKAELATAREGRNDAQREAAVLTAQLAAKTEQANELSERLKTAESRANSQTEELKQANNHYQACAARLEAAAREIESLRKPKPAAAPKTTKKPAAKANANS